MLRFPLLQVILQTILQCEEKNDIWFLESEFNPRHNIAVETMHVNHGLLEPAESVMSLGELFGRFLGDCLAILGELNGNFRLRPKTKV